MCGVHVQLIQLITMILIDVINTLLFFIEIFPTFGVRTVHKQNTSFLKDSGCLNYIVMSQIVYKSIDNDIFIVF